MRRQAENRATVPRGLSVVKRFRNFAEKKQIERLLLLKQIPKRIGSCCIGWATTVRLFTGAIPLLNDVGTFGCSLAGLARYVPPWTTWRLRAPPESPY